MNIFKSARTLLPAFLCLVIFFAIGYPIQGQESVKEDEMETESAELSAPIAVPVLTDEKAQQANNDALKDFDLEKTIQNDRKSSGAVKYTVYGLFGAILVLFFLYLRKKRMVRTTLLRFYRSPLGRLFYCTRFCRWDCWGILGVFCVSFFFSSLAGEKAIRNGYLGNWYAPSAAPVAISIYNTGEAKVLHALPNSKLDNFIKLGSKGDSTYYSITKEDASPQRYSGNTSFLDSTGIAWLMAFWWKIVGYPDWSTMYILFSLFYSLTAVAAYCALRQITGLIPSTVFGLLLFLYPTMMNQVIFRFRDGARALFCYTAIAILLYLLKGGFRWKGTIVSGVFLFVICSLSTYFRQDFIVLIPFVLAAALFFHGKLSSDYKKKITIVSCVIIGLIVSFCLPRTNNKHAMGHVLFIGMAEYPYMNLLHFSADNYSKGISYSDHFGFIVAAGKAYRDRGELNVPRYSEAYDREIKKEIYSLAELYPYDFLRLALSSSIQSLSIGSRFSRNALPLIESAPGYCVLKNLSNDYYRAFPSWLYLVFLLGTILLFLCGRFYNSMFFCLAIMTISGMYMLQFDIRHYFYLMILSLLMAGFVFNRLIRLSFITTNNWKKVWSLCCYGRKKFLLHCSIFAGLIVLAFSILLVAKMIQNHQVKKETNALRIAATEPLDFENKSVTSKIKKKYSAVEVRLPDLYNSTLARENAQQSTFTEFLKVKFKIADVNDKEDTIVFAKYENTDEYKFGMSVGGIINQTDTCPIPLTFSAKPGINTLYMPVYFGRKVSPLIGLELVAGGKDISIESVERISDTKDIRTQSAFLVPENMNEMRYTGNIDWGKVFF